MSDCRQNEAAYVASAGGGESIGAGATTSQSYLSIGNGRRQAPGKPVCASNGHVVGQVRDGVFSKRVSGSIHMLRTPRGWLSTARACAQRS